MNTSIAENEVNWLFIDLNSYFASCEQQEVPELRGKPIIIVQSITRNACAIAASYEAKRFGVKTGTLLQDAKRLCPDVIPVQARHRIYTDYHERILTTIDTCVPIEKVVSIDEMACRLMGSQRQVPAARELALKVKQAFRERLGECMTCSIGLAPNMFLGKVGSDLQKPNGLTVITKDNLPNVFLHLKLQDICGIGRRMEERLNNGGIHTVAQLWQASAFQLRKIWGGVQGLLFHQMLHGADIQRQYSLYSRSMSHEHVLEPERRSNKGAKDYAHHLLTKAGERLRRRDYYCRRLGVSLSWLGHGGYWNEIDFHETQDTDFLLKRLEQLWAHVPNNKPIKVGVVLMGLVPATKHQPDLFSVNPKRQNLSALIDQINNRYGRYSVGFGLLGPEIRSYKGHAAFQRVPESWEF